MFIIDSLVTDRTYNDVRSRTEKGIYKAKDLNRVEAAVKYVAGRLKARGYKIHTEDGPIWDETSIPDQRQMERYLNNIEILRNAVPTYRDTPNTPPDMDMLTYREANNIEHIIADVNRAIDTIDAALMFSGEIYAGEV